MRPSRILTAIIPILLIVSILPAIPSDTADAETAGDGSTFFEDIAEEILGSLDDISEAVSKGIDDVMLPPGSESIISAMTEDEVPVTGTPKSYEYDSDSDVSEIYISGGSSITVGDGVTVTVETLYIMSSEDPEDVDPIEYVGDKVMSG